MLPTRRSPAEKKSDAFVELALSSWRTEAKARPAAKRGADKAGNLAWLAAARSEMDIGTTGDVLLLGGASVADFRIRVAQSQIRHDLTPSYFSLAGIVDGDDLVTVPLWPLPEPSEVPPSNAIARRPIADYDDPARYPNIGVVRFGGTSEDVIAIADRLKAQRSILDLPGLVLAWLGFVWGTSTSANPLQAGLGVPSAAMVETVFGIAEVELTPGLASASSCPEAIYQAAKWWHEFYEQSSSVSGRDTASPTGRYTIRQPQATYIEVDE